MIPPVPQSPDGLQGLQSLQSLQEGAVAGALGGFFLALLDLLGTVLTGPPEFPVEFFFRACATIAPMGAAAGALAATALVAGERWLSSSGRGQTPQKAQRASSSHALRALPLVLLSSPGLGLVAFWLFTGGMTARLPWRSALIGGTFVFLLGASWLAIYVGVMALRWSAESPTRRGLTAVIFMMVSIALTAANQLVFPGLYDYLHACLTALALAASTAAVVSIRRRRPEDINERAQGGDRRALFLLFALATSMVVNLSTLDASPAVRARLFEPHTSHARSVLLAMGPLLSPGTHPPESAVLRARRARARRRRAQATQDLPSWEGAHILLITIDALRPDHLGLNGYHRPTSEVIDRLAEESVVFERAYAQAPHSSYSLTSLMTGEYIHEVAEAQGTLPEATLASALGGVDYRTSAIFPLGIFHTEGERLRAYSDSRFHFAHTNTRSLDARARTDAAIQELHEVVRSGEPPSLTWVHYFDVHEPYRDTHFGTSDVDRYDSEIRRVDHELERLLEVARELLAGEVIIVVTADHGEEFRDHGGVYHGFTLYEEQVRVPLLIRAPGLPPRRVAAPVELVDLAPTLLQMVGVEPPGSMRGDDLRALAVGRAETAGPAYAGVGTQRMVVRYPDKLVADLRFGVLRLFDLESDPDERDNRVTQAPQRVDELQGEIFAWLDGLARPADEEFTETPEDRALNRGRLGDRGTASALSRLLVDDRQDIAQRTEAARLLGLLGGQGTRAALAEELTNAEYSIRVEAAISLGLLRDERGRRPLLAMVARREDPRRPHELSRGASREALPGRRARAAIALGRLGAREALPALPDAAREAPNRRERNEAIRQLGALGGPESLAPLLSLFEDFRSRRPAALALGRLADSRALAPLLTQLEVEGHASIRDAIVEGLGRLGDRRAIPALTALLAAEPTLRNTGESLIRLDALERGAIGGANVTSEGPGLRGFTDCHLGEEDDPYHYTEHAHCTTGTTPVAIMLTIPRDISSAIDGVELIIRLAAAEESATVDVALTLDGQRLSPLHGEGTFREFRQTVSVDSLDGAGELLLAPSASAHIDYVLLVPTRPLVARSAPNE